MRKRWHPYDCALPRPGAGLQSRTTATRFPILQGSQEASESALVSPNNIRGLLLPFFLVTLIWLVSDTSAGASTAATSSSLGNISTRGFVQTGDNAMIGGFVVEGTGTKRVIIRAIGAELTQYGITNALPNPTLALYNASGALMGSNDNWQTTILGGIITTNQVSDIQNSTHAPTEANESAIIADLAPGNYTAIVRGVSNTTGVALVEAYDLSPGTTSILGNISTRGFVQTGENAMVGGFIVQGTGTKKVIIRAIGPELTQYGITNALANPTLELYNASGALMGSNDNWQTTIIGGIITSNQVSDIQNSGHVPTDANESAIIANLAPGNYTAIASGVGNTTGVALVEAYDLDPEVPPSIAPVVPKGIFCMPPAETNGFPDQILNDMRIVGLDVVDKWADVEATEGVYDWSSLDSELAKAEAHGKKVLFGIVSGGLNVPDWLLTHYPNIQTFRFTDTNPYHSTYGQQLTIPIFWDPTFLAKKIALIQAMGTRFSGHSSIVVVGCAFANATTEDWNIPGAPEDVTNLLAAGYTTERMIDIGKTVVDTTMAAFPNQNITMSIARTPNGLDPDPDSLGRSVVDYATTTYGRFITAKYSLAANTPDPATDTSLYNWQVFFNQCPNVSTQMLWFVSGDTTYRMNAGTPGTPGTVLLDAITIGAHYGTQFQEIYETDLEDATLSSVIDSANTLLTVIPPAPAAPSNLNATASGSHVVNLTWHDNAVNELGYRIESKVGATGTYQLLTTLGPNTTTSTINNLVEGTQYYFRVQGVNAAGRSAYSNETSATTPP
jgi:hypothetical protein